jgi:hypothetical protein
MYGQIHEDDLGISEQDVPKDVNPNDPDDESLYFAEAWRDIEDAMNAANKALEEAFLDGIADIDLYEPDELC